MPSQIYDFHNHKIGDTIAAAYCIQALILQEEAAGRPPPDYGLVNRGALDLCTWFPDLTGGNGGNGGSEVSGNSPSLSSVPSCSNSFPPEWEGLPGIPLGNLWISAPTIKLETGILPVMHVPIDDQAYDVALHCLTDAPYNTGRNHTPAQFDELERWLNWHKLRVYRVPTLGAPQFEGSADTPVRSVQGSSHEADRSVRAPTVTDILTQIGRARCFIGGDTGFSHAFAAMHPQRPLIAIYGEDWHNVVGFEAERSRMNCAHPWCSDPLSFRLYKRVMQDHHFDEREVKELLEQLLPEIKQEARE